MPLPRRSRPLLAALLLAVVLLAPLGGRALALPLAAQADATTAADQELTPAKAALLGLIEGITEYLPVSSTGHLLVAQELLGVGVTEETADAADSYAIAIQAGAILAVAVLYRRRIADMVLGLLGRSESGRRALVALVLACIPAVVIALAFEDVIKDNLLGPWPVVAAWAVGGVAILVLAPRLDRGRGGRHAAAHDDQPDVDGIGPRGAALEAITARQALLIGVAQCVAMWPGTSRSLVTILAALAVGLSLHAAVEFSFLLGLVTLSGATAYETVQYGGEMVDTFGLTDPLIGLLVAFVSAMVAVRWLVGYLERHSLAIFGWYRLAIAAVTAGLLVGGVI